MIKLALFLLLAANTVYFALGETPTKAVDAAAWLALLVLFEAETHHAHRFSDRHAGSVIRALRLIAAGAVAAAMLGYVFEENVLDAVNSVLWIAVVVLLEMEVRHPALVARSRGAFGAAAFLLYGGLAVPVVLWTADRAWFDAYDAVLWLIAFATLEADVIQTPERIQAANAR